VFAGLTNFPSPDRDPSKKSRGELPLALARHADAGSAVKAFCREFRPAQYNPAWILVGDRRRLYYIDFTEGDFARARPLGAGIHVLENRPLWPPSAKAAFVAASAERLGPQWQQALIRILASHDVPDGVPDGSSRPRAIEAACVHAGPYGTRWSAIVRVRLEGPPEFHYGDGPSCQATLRDGSAYWEVAVGG
jgi:uncharacterized protein with NRDE domain